MLYKDRNCLECGLDYPPNNSTQKYCVSCGKKKRREGGKEYYQKNKKQLLQQSKEHHKKYYQENKEIFKERQKNNYQKNKEQISEYNKKYRQENKDKSKEYMEKYQQEHKEPIKEYNRKYKQRPEYKSEANFQSKIRRIQDKNYNLIVRLRNRLCGALRRYTKTGKVKTSKRYGIDWEKVIEYLQPFPEDLSKYHIDHIRPLCSFNFINEDGSQNLEEIRIAFAPENHQWLTIQENLIKGGRY